MNKPLLFSAIAAVMTFGVAAQDMNPTTTAYTRPTSNLFYGLSPTNDSYGTSVMVGPVFSPVTYTNTTKPSTATYLWTYADANGDDNTSTEKNLKVTYGTNYSTANRYPFPLLEASSPTTTLSQFQYPGFYQAGGDGKTVVDGTRVDFSLSIIDPEAEGVTSITDGSTPVFGYGPGSDEFWSLQFLRDDYDPEMLDINYAHLLSVGNYFFSPDAPLAIYGVRTNAYGKITKDASFTASFYPLDAGYVISDTPELTTICTAEDITVTPVGKDYDLLSLYFKFDEPLIITKAVCPYFIIAISGFRDSENVEYFNILTSAENNPNNLALGWIGQEVKYYDMKVDLSWSSASYYTPDEKRLAFYIMLDAAFPWLRSDTESIEIMPYHTASVTLDSYYDGQELTFSGLPGWLTAKAEGRYRDTVVTFTANGEATTDQEAKVTIEGPGVSTTVNVHLDTSGVESVIAPEETDAALLFTLDGRRVTGTPVPGIYIRRTASSTSKVLIK